MERNVQKEARRSKYQPIADWLVATVMLLSSRLDPKEADKVSSFYSTKEWS